MSGRPRIKKPTKRKDPQQPTIKSFRETKEKENIKKFRDVTLCSIEEALKYLNCDGWNVKKAIDSFFKDETLRNPLDYQDKNKVRDIS